MAYFMRCTCERFINLNAVIFTMKFFRNLHSKLIILLSITFIVLCTHNGKAQTLEQSFNIAVENMKNIGNLSDSIKKRADYWASIEFDHKFFVLDSAEFQQNKILTLVTNYRKYKEFTMSLKFYPSKDLHVKYAPTLIKEQLLYDHRGHLNIMMDASSSKQRIGPIFSIKKQNEIFFIEKPSLVKYVLKTIPEPHRLITDRKHLNKRSAREGITGLLSGRIDSPDKLNKRIKKKGPWTLNGVENVQFSQAHLENWAKGGENSIALQSDLLLKANYKKDKVEWENYARHKVGIISTQSYKTQVNTDQIMANSKYGVKASKKWYYSGLFDFKTQFFNGFNNKNHDTQISGFMTPAYFTFAVGMDYKPSKNFTLLLSPLTSKITYVMDTVDVDKNRYNVKAEGKKTAYNTGASLTNNINWKISTELNLRSKFEAFVGYSGEEALTQIDWELTFDMRINRFLSTRISTQLKDFTNELDGKTQFRESFAVNFSYKF